MYNTNHGHMPVINLQEKLEMDNVYEMNGYESRQDYLNNLAEDMGVRPEVVFALADILGETEDFDGLVTALDDATNLGDDDWY